jgi:hypothetical protein
MGWLLGWAVPESWFAPMARQAFPGASHTFFAATPGALEQIEAAGPFDRMAGYSLGAQLLLALPAQAAVGRDVVLLAPFFAFARETGLGGRIARAQVRQLARWLRCDPAAALADFYVRAGLDVPSGAVIPPLADLLWGLERLENDRMEPRLPAGWRAWCGAEDPLLDAAALQAAVPEVRIVADATHHPAGLLRVMAEAIA